MSLNSMSYVDNSTSVTVYWNGALTTALVTHLLTGVRARGHAKHYQEDTYSPVVGSDLAVARAKARLYDKVQKKIAKNPIPDSILEEM